MLKGLKKLRISKDITLILIFTAFVSSISVLVNMPSTSPYSPFNTGSNGYSKFLSITSSRINFVKDLKGLDQRILVIIPLKSDPGITIYQLIEDLLKQGAVVVVLDEEGYSNNLLEYLKIKARVERIKILDEVSKIRSREYPLVELSLDGNLLRIATYRPSYIVADEGNMISVAKTSKYAYADLDNNGYYTVGELMGEYVVACSWNIEKGVLWLIADLDIFTNDLIGIGDNLEFLSKLTVLGKQHLIVDYINLNAIDLFKYWFNNLIPGTSAQNNISLALLSYFAVLAATVLMRHVEKR